MNRALITVMMLYVRAISISLVVCFAASTPSFFTHPHIKNDAQEYEALSLSLKTDSSKTLGIESRPRDSDEHLIAQEGNKNYDDI